MSDSATEKTGKIYQVSTLQALTLGYTRKVITVRELLKHGDIGLGGFTNAFGEMIVHNGICYRALGDGKLVVTDPDDGISFASVGRLDNPMQYEVQNINGFNALCDFLTGKADENFSLNSMHIACVRGHFDSVSARSEMCGHKSDHIKLSDIFRITQTNFELGETDGSMICIYYPDYMDGINLPGWHFHYISEDCQLGGHVYDFVLKKGTIQMSRISSLELQLPVDMAFDTYSLKNASREDLKKVEQKGNTQ